MSCAKYGFGQSTDWPAQSIKPHYIKAHDQDPRDAINTHQQVIGSYKH